MSCIHGIYGAAATVSLVLWLVSGSASAQAAEPHVQEQHTALKPITVTPLFFGPVSVEYVRPADENRAAHEAGVGPMPAGYSAYMTQARLTRLFDNMARDGIEKVLLLGGWGETVYYPSEVLKNPSDTDWYARAFDLAAERGMQVILQGVLYTYNDQFTGGTWDPHADLAVNRKVYAELHERYGDRPNLWGWYIPHETGDRTHRGDIMVVLRALPPFLKALTPDKPVAISPWFTSRITLGADATTPAGFAAEWDAILGEIEGVDVCAIQDGTAPDDEISAWFAAAAPVMHKHGVELWSVVELFHRHQDRPGIELFRSIPFPALMERMRAAAPYVASSACWEYQTLLNPASPAPGAAELNAACRAWLENRE